MKERNGYNNKHNNNCPYPIDGQLPKWEMIGYVQDITTNNKYKLDYVKFCIRKAGDAWSDIYEVFSVSVPHDLGYELELGDYLRLTGTIRTWSCDTGRKIELVADNVWLMQK